MTTLCSALYGLSQASYSWHALIEAIKQLLTFFEATPDYLADLGSAGTVQIRIDKPLALIACFQASCSLVYGVYVTFQELFGVRIVFHVMRQAA
jgi:hypothetical protein